MPYEVQVKELPEQLALTVHGRASMATISAEISKAFGVLATAMNAEGVQVVGPPFALYPAEVTAEWDFTLCLPVAPGATPIPGVQLETIPGDTCASTMHKGSYERLGDAYGAMQSWMVANGKKPIGPCREVYLSDPATVPPDEMLTEVNWPFA